MSDDLAGKLLDACGRAGLCVFPCDDHTGDVNDPDVMRTLAVELAPILDEDEMMACRAAWADGWRQGVHAAWTCYQTGLAASLPPDAASNPYERKDTR
ncbi:hypothetical protein [Bifidobacterium jacchi]|uniref:Uncharacterized protein n=1 Tax=Bifidobacterium jacchi TaxID=2490545 RepID=A0A5N5RM26_9BIFI|nr:hypothetical protein [Bifidobacterium jacchi]KAB5608396.1 hypothetical protein EHS19_01880 [Bifidobacterium jacchi]